MAIDMSAWMMNPDGSIALVTSVGHQCVPLQENGVAMLVRFVRPTAPKADTQPAVEALQVAFSTDQARRLGTLLISLANGIDDLSPPRPTVAN